MPRPRTSLQVHPGLLRTPASRLLRTPAARTGPVLLGNKYAQYSKAAQGGLRFSNIDAPPKPSQPRKGAASRKARRPRARWSYPDSAEVDQRDPSALACREEASLRS